MKKKIIQIPLLVSIVTVFLALLSCETNHEPYLPKEERTLVSTPSATETFYKAPGASPSMTFTPTSNSSMTPTPTPSPSMTSTAIPRLTLIRIPTWTPERVPAPTLSKEKAKEMIVGLLKDNGGCQLPCWFGVTPGVTSWAEARRIFEPFSSVEDDQASTMVINGQLHYLKSHSVSIEIPGEDRKWGAFLIDQDGEVISIIVDPITAKRGGFVLSRLLSDYGKPDQIYVMVYAHVPDSGMPFRVVLYYQERNILVDYQLVGEGNDESICVDPKNEGPRLFLWSNDSRYEVSGAEFPEWALFSSEKMPKPIDQVTDFDIESFYQTFKNPNTSEILCSNNSYWP